MLTRYILTFTIFLTLTLTLIAGVIIAVRQSQPHSGNEIAFRAYHIRTIHVTDISRNLVTLLKSQVTGGCPNYSPDGERIIYGVGEEGIYTMDADGRNLEQLLDLPYPDYAGVDWSPDNVYFAFVTRGIDERGYFQLHIYDPNQSEPLLLIEDEQVIHYQWSGDSQHLLYTAYDAESEGYLAYLFDVTTRTTHRIPEVIINGIYRVEYDWSQANGLLVFQYDNDLYVTDSNGGNRYQITYSPAEVEILPSWSPDGNLLAYITHQFEIQIFNSYDYTTPIFTIPGPGIPIPEFWSLFYWSSNRKWLLWQIGRDTLLINVNTGTSTWLESPIGQIECPSWRP